MKILAFCKWLQKEVSLTNMFKNVNKNIKPYKELSNINQLKDSGLIEFIKINTEIVYKTEYCEININANYIDIKLLKKIENLEKVTFISDDRFIIPIFMQGTQVDGLVPYYARKIYGEFSEAFNFIKTLKSVILEYTINTKKDDNGIKRLMVTKDNEEVSFYNASSGIKSLGVIEAIMQYIVQDSEIKSFNTIKRMINLVDIDKLDTLFEITKKLFNVEDRTALFIEEPELSLFPKHQFELMKYLIEVANKKDDLSYVFSTHSPYILSSFNCFLQASRVKNKAQASKILDMKYWINYNKLQAYECKDGFVNSILDSDNGIIFAKNIDLINEDLDTIFDNLVDLEINE